MARGPRGSRPSRPALPAAIFLVVLISALGVLANLLFDEGSSLVDGEGLKPGKLGRPFVIWSGSENETLEPIVLDFCKAQKVTCEMRYQGSLDIGMAVETGSEPIDAVWPANGIWIDMFDKARRVKHLTSISRSPVILGVRKSKAEALGWVGRDVHMADIVEAVESGQLRYLMTSATQSNSGAGAYLAMLSAAIGSEAAITTDDLEKPDTQTTIKALLGGVARTSGSSGWLKTLFLKADAEGLKYDALWNYEAVLAEANQELRQRGSELLWAVYPVDGVAFADSPLGYVDRGQGGEFENFFIALQQHLLSGEVQQQLVDSGRRVALGRADAGTPDPSWNFDPSRFVTAVRMPDPAVVRHALNLYQEALRRPSLTAYCLDFSGSMEGTGEDSLKQAMALLLQPERAREVMIQAGSRDRLMVIPFASQPRAVLQGNGTADDQAYLLAQINQQQAGGGTNIYACANRALEEMRKVTDFENYLPAIVLMTDGRSDGNFAEIAAARTGQFAGVPVFGITFGNAEKGQLDDIAQQTNARVFDGTKSLVRAFRTARGYN